MSGTIGRVQKGPIVRALERATPDQYATIKASAFANAAAQLPTTFTYRGVQITVTSGPVLINDVISITLQASYNGTPIPMNNPYVFHNPPILVQDGTNPIDLKEDLVTAYQTFVGDTVCHVAQQLGWRP